MNLQITGLLDERGISRGVGRGRSLSSLIAYCLGISKIDPIAYQLAFKSIRAEGECLPPLYIEIPRCGVDRLVGALAEIYGDDHILEIGKIREARRDQIINEQAEWAGMTEDEVCLARQEKSGSRSQGAAQRLGKMTDESRSRRWRDPSFIADMATRLGPRPRTLNSSQDRYIVSNEPLDAIVPCIRSVQDDVVSGIGEEALDRMGLARLVFVSHGLLDILHQAAWAARLEDPDIHFNSIPLDDRPTFEMLAQGNTSGIPPLEGVTVRCFLKRERPSNLLQIFRIRNMAVSGDVSGMPPETSDDLADVLLSYQCAFIRANYPLAFFSGAIGSMLQRGENPALLLRQAGKLGIRILPPDINISDWTMSIQGGAIRLGLAAVRGLGRTGWEHIEEVRSGGRFTSLENFCDRIDNHLIRLRTLRSLIACGAMDDLDPDGNRARMNMQVPLLQRKARGQIAPPADDIDQGSLFEMEDIVETPIPTENQDPGEFHEWNPWEIIQHEMESLGFSLYADPIDSRRDLVGHLQPRQVHQIRPRFVQDEICVVGLIGSLDSGGALSEEPGDVLVDVEGLSVYLSASVARLSETTVFHAAEVMIIGNLNQTRGFQCLDASGIWLISDLEEQASQVSKIGLNLEGLDKDCLRRLLRITRRFPGNTELEIRNGSADGKRILRKIQRSAVYFCSPLYQALCGIIGKDSIELFGFENELLIVHAVGSSGVVDQDLSSSDEPTE